MPDFYHRLSYSFGNEDWTTEQKALQIEPGNHVLCITASGDRPLNLLLTDCNKISSVDANPIQNALLNLKCTALQLLTPDEYLAFMGLAPHEERIALFEKIKPHMAPEAVAYWQKKQNDLKKGIIFRGAVEKLCVLASHIIRILNRSKVKKLFSFTDVQEQSEFIKKEWDSRAWRVVLSVALSRPLTRLFVKDPGLYAYVGESINIGKYLRDRIFFSLENHLAKTNPLLSLIFQGKIEKEALPPYLTTEGAENLKDKTHKIHWETKDIISFLKTQPDCTFDRFSLSDVASYISQKEFAELTREIVRTAKPNARFCLRQFLSCQTIPDDLQKHYCREEEIEKELEKMDKCFVYRFMVGTIKK